MRDTGTEEECRRLDHSDHTLINNAGKSHNESKDFATSTTKVI